ncbi:MAG: CRISPR-associated ring nuclease Crn3/Csx3 [Candidatus Asgardarchaeia archaeon]
MNSVGITFRTMEEREYTIVHFELETIIEPAELSTVKPPKVNPTKGVILSGRGPIWLYCFLVHHYHSTKFIATYDPRLGGAVVVESHIQNHKPGELIKLDCYDLLDLSIP